MSYFYFAYPGNKRSEYKYIKHLIDKINFDIIVEPFCGSCSTSIELFKNNNKIKIHLNDNDSSLIELFKNIKIESSEKYFNYVQEITKSPDYSKIVHNKIIKKYESNKTNSELFFYYRKCFNFRPGLYPDQKTKNNKYIRSDRHKLFDVMLKKSLLSCLDYSEIFEKYKNNDSALLFIDPPYLDSYNAHYYSNSGENTATKIDNTTVFIDILNLLKNAKCYVICIMNDNSLIRYIYDKYIIGEYPKSYSCSIKCGEGYVKKNTKHLIISNISI